MEAVKLQAPRSGFHVLASPLPLQPISEDDYILDEETIEDTAPEKDQIQDSPPNGKRRPSDPSPFIPDDAGTCYKLAKVFAAEFPQQYTAALQAIQSGPGTNPESFADKEVTAIGHLNTGSPPSQPRAGKHNDAAACHSDNEVFDTFTNHNENSLDSWEPDSNPNQIMPPSLVSGKTASSAAVYRPQTPRQYSYPPLDDEMAGLKPSEPPVASPVGIRDDDSVYDYV
jgi:hypothetical protein